MWKCWHFVCSTARGHLSTVAHIAAAKLDLPATYLQTYASKIELNQVCIARKNRVPFPKCGLFSGLDSTSPPTADLMLLVVSEGVSLGVRVCVCVSCLCTSIILLLSVLD